ncbi:hypothetical protein OVY01_04730 [Robbsia sp. Bb-Pol-6]|uniref:Peptidase S9 prolyl oligopeptidase catalytic domain-containing protein n=1 Tax=Robbsia betulipollinis TaxID=2981849 RepID=A0ABT3ZJN2_9BURK|nr:hypothetical protein [Robbsia betulipollinis]MCY0386552.1 hypothetical protein [Robbsia betulipollinis]
MTSFATLHALRAEPAFDADLLLRGAPCAPHAGVPPGCVTVEIDGSADHLRFYGRFDRQSTLPPVIFLDGDMLGGSRFDATLLADDDYAQRSPASLQREAEQYAIATGRLFVHLARPGVYGSSGDHTQRRRPREIALVDAAIDQLKLAFSWDRIDLCGFSGGAHLVAALLSRRRDVRRAVMASGVLAVRRRMNEENARTDVTGYADFVDPLDLVADVAAHAPRGIVVLTDPDDAVVSAAVQTAYVDALRRAGVAVDYRMMSAADPAHHDLRLPAIMCALTS